MAFCTAQTQWQYPVEVKINLRQLIAIQKINGDKQVSMNVNFRYKFNKISKQNSILIQNFNVLLCLVFFYNFQTLFVQIERNQKPCF